LVTFVKRWDPVWIRISHDAAFGHIKCITGRDIGMRGLASGAVLCPLRLATSWRVKMKGLEPHSSLTIGGEWHLQEMQMAALLDMGLQCYNVMGWKACLAHVNLCLCGPCMDRTTRASMHAA
jgi:hypothetical protein